VSDVDADLILSKLAQYPVGYSLKSMRHFIMVERVLPVPVFEVGRSLAFGTEYGDLSMSLFMYSWHPNLDQAVVRVSDGYL
jgi:hypothetical protein